MIFAFVFFSFVENEKMQSPRNEKQQKKKRKAKPVRSPCKIIKNVNSFVTNQRITYSRYRVFSNAKTFRYVQSGIQYNSWK